MPPNKDAIVPFVGPVIGQENKMDRCYGESPETIQTYEENQARYSCVETKATDPRHVKCFDNQTQKTVWGKYEQIGRNKKLSIFIPNI